MTPMVAVFGVLAFRFLEILKLNAAYYNPGGYFEKEGGGCFVSIKR